MMELSEIKTAIVCITGMVVIVSAFAFLRGVNADFAVVGMGISAIAGLAGVEVGKNLKA